MRRSARALIVENGKLLVMERWRRDKTGRELHYISIPGGAIEEGESPEAAVVRELDEEMLIAITPLRHIATLHAPTSAWYHAQEHIFFLCNRTAGEPRLNLESEEVRFGGVNNRYKPGWRELSTLQQKPYLYELYQPVVEALLPTLQGRQDPPDSPLDITV